MEINFATHNLGKLKEARLILEPSVKVNHIEMEYEEIQDEDPKIVAERSAVLVSTLLSKAVVVDDSGMFISALNGFPGTFSSTIHKQIGLKGLLKLMEGVSNRECFYRTVACYCEPGKKPISFLGEQKGMISESIRGSYGFGHDPIFIPQGETRTFGEIEDCEHLKSFRRDAFIGLKQYLSHRHFP